MKLDLFLALIALSAPLIFIAEMHLRWLDRLPSEFYRGVGIRYLKGASRPWQGIESVIDTFWETFAAFYPSNAPQLMDKLWIEVVPYAGLCFSPTIPTGYLSPEIDGDSGSNVLRRANGTYRHESFLGLFHRHTVLVVRQLRDGDSVEENLHASGKGRVCGAGEHSALFHVMGAHVAHHMIYGRWNNEHTSLLGESLARNLKAQYARLKQSRGS